MDMLKMGRFIKELRKSKQMTQEQLAEVFGASRRTVSLWETGNNLPDLDILVEMADYFRIDLRELLEGERKSEKTDCAFQKTAWKVADYSKKQKKVWTRRVHLLFVVGFVAALIYTVLFFSGYQDCFLGSLCLGITFGMMIVGIIMTSRYTAVLQNYKRKFPHKPVKSKRPL